jgi:hypothetical protein
MGLVVAGALVAPATPPLAHGGDAPDATAYRTTVTALTPPMDGLSVRTVEAGARLELTNRTGRTIEVLGYAGEPYLEVRPDGTYENVSSPATYLNRTLAGDTPVPASADPTAPPSWRRVSEDTTVRWHDQRTHWLSPGLPPAAAADPSRSHRLRDWVVPLRDEVRTLEVRGTLAWLPPPTGWLWWAGAALLALAITALAGRWSRAIAPAALLAGCALIGYGVAKALDGTQISPVLAISAVAALVTGIVAFRRRAGFPIALSGALVAVFGGLTEIPVFRAAVLPAAGPAWLARTEVMLGLGIGAAMLVTGIARIRAASATGSPVYQARAAERSGADCLSITLVP